MACTNIHQTQLLRRPDQERLVVVERFYLRHTLRWKLFYLSDNECMVLSAVRFNSNDASNLSAWIVATEDLTTAKRGSMVFVQVWKREKIGDGEFAIAQNCRFIVFKDKVVFTRWNNELTDTPSLHVSMVLQRYRDGLVKNSCAVQHYMYVRSLWGIYYTWIM